MVHEDKECGSTKGTERSRYVIEIHGRI
jgi:hypothetical protein